MSVLFSRFKLEEICQYYLADLNLNEQLQNNVLYWKKYVSVSYIRRNMSVLFSRFKLEEICQCYLANLNLNEQLQNNVLYWKKYVSVI